MRILHSSDFFRFCWSTVHYNMVCFSLALVVLALAKTCLQVVLALRASFSGWFAFSFSLAFFLRPTPLLASGRARRAGGAKKKRKKKGKRGRKASRQRDGGEKGAIVNKFLSATEKKQVADRLKAGRNGWIVHL